MSWEYMPHQIKAAKEAKALLKKYGYCYIFGEPRSGKTATALWIIEHSKIKNILIVTPKKAISGWKKAIDSLGVTSKNIILCNPESLHKIRGRPELLILDESHRFGNTGRPSKRYKELRRITKDGVLHLHLSGTPITETPLAIYYQMHLPSYSPFKCKTFYEFFRKWGIPSIKYIGGRTIEEYKLAKPELLEYINKFVVTITQKDAGIDIVKEDKLIYLELSKVQKEVYNAIVRDKMYKGKIGGQKIELIADSVMKERLLLHQIEGGVIKTELGAIRFAKKDITKYQYLLTLGTQEKIGVMSHFRAEQEFLRTNLPSNFEVYSSNAHAEGVDLSHLDRFIIYSQDYSGAKHIQRRDRIVNIQGSKTNKIYYLLVKNAISEQVYKAVSQKLDFNNSLFEAKEV